MSSLFWRQFKALFLKNWIILAKHPILTIFRCFVIPVAVAIFLAYAQVFLTKPDSGGLGTAVPVARLSDVFNPSLALVWSDDTNDAGSIRPDDIMARATKDFSSKQLASVRKASTSEIGTICQENFLGSSGCFASVTFEPIPEASGISLLNYTVRADGGLRYGHVNVRSHTSDLEIRMFPLQWAIDSAIIALNTGVTPSTPVEWPFTYDTSDTIDADIRLAYLSFASVILTIVFFVVFVEVSYQLPNLAVKERASGLTSHMKAMGLGDAARILSWHLSFSLAYLPAWLITAGIWHVKLWTGTNAGLLVAIHILTGLSVTSYATFSMAPFGKSPQLAAISSLMLAYVCCILGMTLTFVPTSVFFVLILLFPPMFYPVAIRCITGFELNAVPTSSTTPDPNFNLTLWPLMIAVVIGIFVWPWVGALWERSLYDAQTTRFACWGRRKKESSALEPPPPGMAISVRNLGKDFRTTGWFKRKKGLVTAISDLTLDIPKHGIFVLLGPNGAGKSTTMSILGGLTSHTRGSVVFEGGAERPPRGSIGLVPQKNILFPELTCYQTLHLWKDLKPETDREEDIVQLLKDCDLGAKIHHDASALSGGQKRKLQLAVGLIGGSKIILVDECTSGVDPLSRRAIWKTLTSVKDDRTVVFTTHFLDEADLLADDIAVLAAPGKLVAHGSPVALKSSLGEGYTMRVTHRIPVDSSALLTLLRDVVPEVHVTGSHELVYHLKTHDPAVVRVVLEIVEREKRRLYIDSYAVSATTIEDIFLDLMQDAEKTEAAPVLQQQEEDEPTFSPESLTASPAKIDLTNGTHRNVFGQALTIFHKRCLVARRSWLSYVLALVVACVIPTISLKFVPTNAETCAVITTANAGSASPLFMPDSYLKTTVVDPDFWGLVPFVTPPGLLSALGNETSALAVQDLPSNDAFVQEVSTNYTVLINGGISFDLQSGTSLFAWQALMPMSGPVFLNMVSNLNYNKALNDTGRTLEGGAPKFIAVALGSFPTISSGSLTPLVWAAFFGVAMAIFPAFFTLYVAQERRSLVQAMQFSNGLSNPAGLWLGHVVFDALFSVIAATILVIVFATKSTLFQGLGYLWFIIVLHGFTGSLFAYLWTLWIKSPTGAFAAVMAYQLVVFGLYLAGYMLTLTYSLVTESATTINIIHFTLALISPSFNVVRAGFVSVNLFALLCEGSSVVPSSSLGSITRFGGPILYLILHGLLLFGVLVLADSGSMLKQRLLATRSRKVVADFDTETKGLNTDKLDVLAEAQAVEHSSDALKVLGVSKTFNGAGTVVDGVSFGVATDTIFALLGPNGAGKTTTFNMIRGDLTPDTGEILINGRSITRHTQTARVSLGVCPQFTAIDAQLTVREHLQVYARLKGLRRGAETARNVEGIMTMTNLSAYADRMANKLSGGNQRKLALAIALIGNPSVVLIDEFSSGVDAKMKRDMWGTLKNVAVGKAIVITTHSMEEASTLANKVGIIAKHMLAVGTTDTLLSRYDRYLVHFPGRTREDVVRARELMARIPGARMANDVATRFEVPVGDSLSLAQLFAVLADATKENGGGIGEYAVEKASLESVFMKVIRDNAVEEGDGEARRKAWWRWFA